MGLCPSRWHGSCLGRYCHPQPTKDLLFKLMHVADKNADYFVADPEAVEKALSESSN